MGARQRQSYRYLTPHNNDCFSTDFNTVVKRIYLQFSACWGGLISFQAFFIQSTLPKVSSTHYARNLSPRPHLFQSMDKKSAIIIIVLMIRACGGYDFFNLVTASR